MCCFLNSPQTPPAAPTTLTYCALHSDSSEKINQDALTTHVEEEKAERPGITDSRMRCLHGWLGAAPLPYQFAIERPLQCPGAVCCLRVLHIALQPGVNWGAIIQGPELRCVRACKTAR